MKLQYKLLVVILLLLSFNSNKALAENSPQYLQGKLQPGNSDQASKIIDQIKGDYTAPETINDGSELARVDETLQIVRVAKDAIYFNIALIFDYNHTCNLAGIANYKNIGAFVYVDNNSHAKSTSGDIDDQCQLKLFSTKAGIYLEDKGTCSSYCGARGYFDGISFKASQRKPIAETSSLYKQANHAYVSFTQPDGPSFNSNAKPPPLAVRITKALPLQELLRG